MRMKLMMEPDTLAVIRSRRVIRPFTAKPVPDELLWKILEAARWAPAGSNRRVQRYVCLTGPQTIHQIMLVSPCMAAAPPALIVVCFDLNLVEAVWTDNRHSTMFIDVGTAAENMLLAAHALGLGGWPMTPTNSEAIRVILNLSEELEPVMFIGLGYPGKPPQSVLDRPKKYIRLKDIVHWGPFPEEPETGTSNS